jgi:hypothetical protein
MTIRFTVCALLLAASLAAQAPQAVDTSTVGPKVGDAIPPFEGVDQFGKRHTQSSAQGPKGTMLVFFRSADW